MRRIIVLLVFVFALVLLIGCVPQNQTLVNRHQAIKEAMGTHEVHQINGYNIFIVRDVDGAIWTVSPVKDDLFYEKLLIFPAITNQAEFFIRALK